MASGRARRVISAFNFPVAVWAWNAALALVCGDSVIWKPSEKTPLTALATQALFERAVKRFGDAPAHLSQVVLGLRDAGEALAKDHRIPVVSATGSTRMGRELAPVVAAALRPLDSRTGGNNAMIVCAIGEARSRAARDPVRRGRHGGPALHERCAVCSCMKSIYDTLVPGAESGLCETAHRQSAGERHAGRSADRQARVREHGARARRGARRRRQGHRRRSRARRANSPTRIYVKPAIVEMPDQIADGLPRNLRADSLCDALSRFR